MSRASRMLSTISGQSGKHRNAEASSIASSGRRAQKKNRADRVDPVRTCGRHARSKMHDAKLRAGIRSESRPEGEGSESLLQDLPYLRRIIRPAASPTI